MSGSIVVKIGRLAYRTLGLSNSWPIELLAYRICRKTIVREGGRIGSGHGEGGMKRYLIFAVLGPLLGGFWLLLTTTVMSGYWSHPPSPTEVEKLFAVFAKTLQYSYLFGILPTLMMAAVDDILSHVKRIAPVVRMLIVGALAFVAAELLYGSRGSDSGVLQVFFYGLGRLFPPPLPAVAPPSG